MLFPGQAPPSESAEVIFREKLFISRFRKLTAEHIEYIVGCIESSETKIKNIKAYLISALFNAPTTIANSVSAEFSYYQNLSENFIREFQSEVDWFSISYQQILSEDFIREFQYKVDWENISYKQKLSEDFIREFADEVYWWEISCYQDLSESFRKEFADKLF